MLIRYAVRTIDILLVPLACVRIILEFISISTKKSKF